MSENIFKELGFTKEEMKELLIQRLADNIGEQNDLYDELENSFDRIKKEAIDKKISEIATQELIPKIDNLVNEIVLQKTNEWGEKKGEKFTFTEYLVSRANDYLLETVNSRGESRKESSGAYFDGQETRIKYLIGKHLQEKISNSITEAFNDASNTLANALLQEAKQKIEQLSEKMKNKCFKVDLQK